MKKNTPTIGAKPLPLLITIGVGILLWFIPHPESVTDKAWHLFAIFTATIVGVIARPLPVSPVVLMGVVTGLLTHTLTFEAVFKGFSSATIWLIVMAFFLARGLIKSGLAVRVAYYFISILGKSPLGLAYGLMGGELLLAPFIPSIVARAGGVIYPILLAVVENTEDGEKRVGSFLTLSTFQGSVVCGAMFLTAMAANPLTVAIAADFGITVTWGVWALAAIVPGLLTLALIPLVVYKLSPPAMSRTPEAPAMAKAHLKAMGKMTTREWIMLGTFSLVFVLWIAGPSIGVNSTLAAMIGLVIVLLTGTLDWRSDCLQEMGAWDTLFWLSSIISMGLALKDEGFFSWLSDLMVGMTGGLQWGTACAILLLLYFYTHYLFASCSAHVTAMYSAFLAALLAVGTPPLLAALALCFLSNLFGGLTHYSTTPAPIFYGSRYVSLKKWWKVGFFCGLLFLAIWLGIGTLWWKFLGIW